MFTYVVSWYRVGDVLINKLAFGNLEVAREFCNKVVAYYNIEGTSCDSFGGESSHYAIIKGDGNTWCVIMRTLYQFNDIDAALEGFDF